MLKFFAIISILFSLSSYAVEMDVISAEFQVENELNEKTLCLTVVRVPSTGELVGIVEDIYDCFYARTAKRNPHQPLEVNPKYLSPIQEQGLLDHLQRNDAQLDYYFSDGE